MPSHKIDLMLEPKNLEADERVFYRDQLRSARYAALADAEGFHEVCYALETLGLRLYGRKADLGSYKPKLNKLSQESEVLAELTQIYPSTFTAFDALFELVRTARNDVMHTGVYARHATAAAIELCIGLEAAIMKHKALLRHQVKHYMVKSPVTVEPWQPVAHARQLMLTHSFSFLPVQIIGCWKLISETSMARYLQFGVSAGGRLSDLLAQTIQDAGLNGLELSQAQIVRLDDEVRTLLQPSSDSPHTEPRLWLVEDSLGNLCGVLSPFELM
jgi:CBS domain-containing protein